ncbi:MAG: hypothetical protein P1V18_04405 [Candidatus Gracilibacteria bacterium]|nr:hypothetical protein [Candidatus Gracilibacteria bacterium]
MIACGGSSTGGNSGGNINNGGVTFNHPNNPNTRAVSTALVSIEKNSVTSREARIRINPINMESRNITVRILFPNGEFQSSDLAPMGGQVLTPFYVVDNEKITLIFSDEQGNQVAPPADLDVFLISSADTTAEVMVQIFGPGLQVRQDLKHARRSIFQAHLSLSAPGGETFPFIKYIKQ